MKQISHDFIGSFINASKVDWFSVSTKLKLITKGRHI